MKIKQAEGNMYNAKLEANRCRADYLKSQNIVMVK